MIRKLPEFIYEQRHKLFLVWLVLLILSAFFLKPLNIDGSSNETNMQDDPYFKAMAKMDSLFGKGPDVILQITPKQVSLQEVQQGLDALEDSLSVYYEQVQVESILDFGGAMRKAPVGSFLKWSTSLPMAKDVISTDTLSFLASVSLQSGSEMDLEYLNAIGDLEFVGIEKITSFSFLQLAGEIKLLLQRDLFLLPLVLLSFFVLFLLYVYRSWQSVAICILGILPSVFFTLVCFSFFDANVNLITLLAIPIVIVLSIADIVHLITGFYSPTYHQEEKSVKIIQSLKAYLLPSFLTSLTTCLAFYSLALSQSEHIQKLGLIAGTAIIGSFFFTYLLIPILLRWLPNKKLKDHGVTKLSKHFSTNRKLYAIAMVLCFLSSLFFVQDIEFKSDFENFFPKNSPMGKNYKELNTNYSSQAKLNILIEKRDEKANGTLAKTVDEVAALANTEENVLQLTYARSASKNRVMGISPFGLQSLTQKYDLKKNFISEDAATERIELRFSSPEEIKNFEDKMSNEINELTNGYQVDYASSSLVMEAVDKNIASALIKSLVASTLLIIVVILFLTRSIPQTFFSLLANLAPLSAIILVLGVFGLKLNILTAITSVVCLGLIVDDTIHVLYRKVRLKSDLHELGIGMLSTSILLTGGFLSLNLSYFVPTQTFGNISSVVFVITLVSDLTLLPLLLDSYRKKKDFT